MTKEYLKKYLSLILLFIFPSSTILADETKEESFVVDESLGQVASEEMGHAEEIKVIEEIEPTLIPFYPQYYIKTNLLPWVATIANAEGEISIDRHWSIDLSLWYCPWIVSQKHSLKTLAILPEGRWWLKESGKGHFFNLHLSVAWFNLRFGDDRYQDTRPLLGAGIGYGYRLMLNENFGFEFSIGTGYMSMKYDRYYNIPNGALIDTRITSYFGIDRASVSFVYKFDR